MDLMSAKAEAKRITAEKKGTKVYLLANPDGEISFIGAPIKGVIHCFKDGAEVPLPSKNEAAAKVKKAKKGIQQDPETVETETASADEEKQPVKTKTKKVKKMAKSAKAKPAKKAKTVKAKSEKSGEAKLIRGNNMALTAAEWKKVDAILAKAETSFSAWSRGLVLAKI